MLCAPIMISTVVCFRSKYTSRYFVLPCCHYDFDCKFSGKKQGLSNYRTYLNFVKEIGEVCGFKVEEDTLRIPSTKRVSGTVLSTYNAIGSNEKSVILNILYISPSNPLIIYQVWLYWSLAIMNRFHVTYISSLIILKSGYNEKISCYCLRFHYQWTRLLITYIVWWYKTLYQVEPVVWTKIITRRVVMRLVHATGKTWYKLYQHTMYVISLS
jgi:hypothetical protein